MYVVIETFKTDFCQNLKNGFPWLFFILVLSANS